MTNVPTVVVNNTSKNRRDLVTESCLWLLDLYELLSIIKISISFKQLEDCWGYCHQVDDHVYVIALQSRLRSPEMLSTLMHELIHVRQWETSRWDGDGEPEAESAGLLLARIFSKIKSEKV